MKDKILNFLDTLSSILEHPFIGLIVWVAIVVLPFFDASWNEPAAAGLAVIKTYCSGSWERKRNGKSLEKQNEEHAKNTNLVTPATGSNIDVK